MRVYVYRNLHKNCFSIKALEGPNKGRVIAHRNEVQLTEVAFKVSKAGQAKVRRERKKYVHAGVVGDWSDTVPLVDNTLTPIYYNPYVTDTFICADSQEPIHQAISASLRAGRIFAKVS